MADRAGAGGQLRGAVCVEHEAGHQGDPGPGGRHGRGRGLGAAGRGRGRRHPGHGRSGQIQRARLLRQSAAVA